jgi:hypothetical protein
MPVSAIPAQRVQEMGEPDQGERRFGGLTVAALCGTNENIFSRQFSKISRQFSKS